MFKPDTRALLVLLIVTLFSLALVTPGLAQNATPPIVLDDATPSIDAVITPANGAVGVVMLELEGVQVRLTTATNVDILSIADARVQSFAFQFANGAAPHILRIERLPGTRTGRVNILPQSALPVAIAPGNTTPITTLSNATSGVVTAAPATSLPVVASAGANLFSAQVTKESTIQLVDNAGGTLFTMQAGTGIQAIAARLAPGLYLANINNKDATARNDIAVALSNAPESALGTAAPTGTGTQIAISTRRPTPRGATATPRPRVTARPTDDHGDDDHGGHGGDDGGDHDKGDDHGGGGDD